MALLWYRDPADGTLKPYAVPGEELSFSTYLKADQSVPTGASWTRVAAPDADPVGDDVTAWGSGEWTAPGGGVWQVEFTTHCASNIDVATRITVGGKAFVQASPAGASGENGAGVFWIGEVAGGTVLEFWVNHSGAAPLALSTKITATRHRRYTPTPGLRAGEGSEFVLKAGDTMTGPLVLSGDPALSMGAATKNYADGKVEDFAWGDSPTVAPSQKSVNTALTGILATEINAGGGLSGGGALGDNPSFDVGQGWGITVGENDVAVDQGDLDDRYAWVGGANVSGLWPIDIAGTAAYANSAGAAAYADNAGAWDGARLEWSGQGVLSYYLMSDDGVWFYPVYYGQHTHIGPSAGHSWGAVWAGSLAPGSSYSWWIGHGLGYMPSMVTSGAYYDDGNHSISTSCGSWDDSSVLVNAKNYGTAAEECGVGVIVFA